MWPRVVLPLDKLSWNLKLRLATGRIPCSQHGANPARIPVDIKDLTDADIPVLSDAKYPHALLLDGKRVMMGDLDLAANSLLTSNLILEEADASNFQLLRKAGGRAGIYVYDVSIFGSLSSSTSTLANIFFNELRPPWGGASAIHAWSGGWIWEVATITSAFGGSFNIGKAGNITLLSTALLNAIDGVLRLPNTRPTTPQACDTRYDPATDTFEIYDGTQWRSH